MSVLFTRRGMPPTGGTLASSLEIGSSVYLNVNGVSTEFLIVHQGLPSSIYDKSCDGTWLLMKDAYEKREWNSSGSKDYGASTIHTYLNNDFLSLFDINVQNTVAQVKIPYVDSTGAVALGSNGLSTQIFLLSAYEVGFTNDNISTIYADGACLLYFNGTATADSKRVAYLNGEKTNWTLRSPDGDSANSIACILVDGTCQKVGCTVATVSIRPALILPSNAVFDPTTMEFVGVSLFY